MSPFPQINSNDPRPIYQQIADSFRQAVVAGRMHVDDQLPSVRDLAIDLRVNPNTVQHAYRELEREGLIHVRRGQGSFIAAGAASATSQRVRHDVALSASRAAASAGMSVQDLITELHALVGPADRAATGRLGVA